VGDAEASAVLHGRRPTGESTLRSPGSPMLSSFGCRSATYLLPRRLLARAVEEGEGCLDLVEAEGHKHVLSSVGYNHVSCHSSIL
jgi:hypothetical protein